MVNRLPLHYRYGEDGYTLAIIEIDAHVPQMALNPMQEQFALWYVRQPNATKAAIKAGYSATSAHSTGHELLKHPEVAALIASERAARAARLFITPERIAGTLAAIAFGDSREVVSWDGDGNVEISPSDTLHEDEAMMVDGIIRKERTDADGNTTTSTEIKLSNRQAALDKLARIQGLYKDRVEVTDGDGLAARLEAKRLARIAARKQGEDTGDGN